jgi:hypothetical protein
MPSSLYTPPDVDQAHAEWGANCGPAALAAIIGSPLAAVKDAFQRYGFGQRGYCNPSQMVQAVRDLGHSAELTRHARTGIRGREFPQHGVVFLQFTSEYIDCLPIPAQYRLTHWIGMHSFGGDSLCVYDVNSGWEPWQDWCVEVWPRLAAANRNATESWTRSAYEIRRREV